MKELSKPHKAARKSATAGDKEIAQRVKELRIEQNYSQDELADYLNLSQRQIGDYENGKHRISSHTLQKIAEFMHTPISYFYGEEKDILSRVEKKLNMILNLFLEPDGAIKTKLNIGNEFGLRDYLISKGVTNPETLNDLEMYFRFTCERDEYNFETIWYT